jgi:adenine-specific DNA methylase
MKEKKYIEEKFPIAEINRICVSERIALKPIYMMHRIFARRIGSVFRVIILGALKECDVNIMKEFYKSHKNDPDTNGVVILDPMCGGGTTLVEGSRLGAKVIGFEINPIPWFVTKCELTKIDTKELKEEFKLLEKKVGRKIKDMYKTTCPNCKSNSESIYVFWIKKVNCPRCKKEIKLFKDYIITYNKKETKFYLVCPHCMNVFLKNGKPKEIEKCPNCNLEFSPNKGVVVNNHVTCPHCTYDFKLVDVLKSSDLPLDAEPYAIDGWCPSCHRRFIKSFDENDRKLLDKIENEFENKKEKLLFPREDIPDGYNTNQMKKHNYRYWYQMFNKRQLLALSLLLEEISKIKNEKIKEVFLLAFSESLRSNNMFCYYDRKWAKQNTPLFARKDFAPVNFPLEQNVWGSKYGRGTFIQVFQRVLKGKEYNLQPFERQYTSKGSKRVEIKEVIGEAPWEVYCIDAQMLDEIIKEKVDLVITDPPYFDSINYSEVYDFFYVWLKKVLNYPCFNQKTTQNPNEAIVNEIQGKNKEHFKRILSNIFIKSTKVLKDNGLFIFTFHDISIDAWKDMLNIINNAGLEVVKVHFYHGENVSAGHFGGQKSVFDSIWVCKKISESKKQKISLKECVDKIWEEVKAIVKEARKSKFFKLDENDIKIFIYGKTIEVLSKYSISEKYEEIVKIALNNDNLISILKPPEKILISDFID